MLETAQAVDQAWTENRKSLAQFCWNHFFARKDTFGWYTNDGSGKRAVICDLDGMHSVALSLSRLEEHFTGSGRRIGTYTSMGPDCKILVIDIDAHGAPQEVNWKYA